MKSKVLKSKIIRYKDNLYYLLYYFPHPIGKELAFPCTGQNVIDILFSHMGSIDYASGAILTHPKCVNLKW